jgi:recombinational DNA repair protein (RecF pathway)
MRHYGGIVQDIDHTMLGYELIKLLHKVTEDEPEAEYYVLLEQAFSVLDDPSVSVDFIRMWFSAQLLRLAGHTPNLQNDTEGSRLSPDGHYEFDYDSVAFRPAPSGAFAVQEIKYLRLIFGASEAAALSRIEGEEQLTASIAPLVATLRQLQLHK